MCENGNLEICDSYILMMKKLSFWILMAITVFISPTGCNVLQLSIEHWHWTKLSPKVGSSHYNVCKYCNGRQIYLETRILLCEEPAWHAGREHSGSVGWSRENIRKLMSEH